jgi:SAM-dependent methyltransferase
VSVERPELPSEERSGWVKTYARTPYRDLPWFSPRPYDWLQRGVREHWLRPGAKVLDIGCGAGTNAIFLARSGFRASGLDLAPAAIEAGVRRARRAGLKVDFRVGDALRMPFSKGSFGGLTDVGCFHTLPIGLRDAYAAELSRVLRPGGTYLLSWVAREYTESMGPPHRPSVEEVASTFESRFLIRRIESLRRGRANLPAYGGVLERRAHPQPPPR